MSNLTQRINHGEQARAVLENEAWARAFDRIEQEHVEAWKNSPARDPAGRESLWTSIKLLHKLKATLEAEMMDGRLASIEAEQQETLLVQERRQGLALHGPY